MTRYVPIPQDSGSEEPIPPKRVSGYSYCTHCLGSIRPVGGGEASFCRCSVWTAAGWHGWREWSAWKDDANFDRRNREQEEAMRDET